MRGFYCSKYTRHEGYRWPPKLQWVYDCSWLPTNGDIIGIQLVTKRYLYSLIWRSVKQEGGIVSESASHTSTSSTSSTSSDTINRQASVTPSMSADWSRYANNLTEISCDALENVESFRDLMHIREQSRAELEDDEPPVDIYEDTRPDAEDEEPAGFGMAPKNPAPFRPVRTFRYINKFTGGKT